MDRFHPMAWSTSASGGTRPLPVMSPPLKSASDLRRLINGNSIEVW